MTIRKTSVRGLRDIRTYAGTVDNTALPHKAYLKMSCLEMEKFRHGKERDSALGRLKRIDARAREIDAEEAALMRSLGKRDSEGRERGGPADAPMSVPDEEARHKSRGFKLKY